MIHVKSMGEVLVDCKHLGRKKANVEAVFAILNEIAPEIPLRLDTIERQHKIKKLVEDCCQYEPCWVCLDEGGKVIGFLLTKRCSIEIPRLEFNGLELLYGGMKREHRRHGNFVRLLAQAKAQKSGLLAVVKHDNISNVAKLLEREDFERRKWLKPNEDAFVWTATPR
jgi:hypothetical protein